MARTISIVNQKGGVGKTTTSINLAAYLSHLGYKVLLVDIDPQGNASSGLGFDIKTIDKGVYEVLVIEPVLFSHIIRPTNLDRLRLAPATPNLAGAAIDLVDQERREYKLWENLNEVKELYDFIIIDSPPSLGLLTINGLVASDDVLIPVQCEYYALEGLGQLLHTINLVKDNLKPELNILGSVLTMFDSRNKLSEDVFNEIYRYFPNKIFRSVIPRNVRLAEAPSHGLSILEYDEDSRGGRAYEKLAREVLGCYGF
jgi:chromosome partitioning protein